MALIRSFNQTNLDLEDSQPIGGPINDRASGFVHLSLPNNRITHYSTAVTRAGGAPDGSPLAYGGNRVYGKPTYIFDKTDLDLEDKLQNGGPINDPASGFLHLSLPTNRTTWYSNDSTRWA